ncbi:high-affinity nitrate transporter 3.1-like protein [Tanacetum coccineum]|uniref:High-affinity nitrate transporter 3.1-like protein n=1 Tax=Tanacetum coccineum TaxID=301880 RepID=A0ABQ5B1C9_9ASTR
MEAHPAFLLLIFISCFATASYAHNVHLSALNKSIIVTASPTPNQVLKAGVDSIMIMWSYNLSFMATSPDTNHTNYNTSKGYLCYAPVSQMGRDDRKTDDLLDEDKTCPVEIIQMPYQRANNSYTWLIPSNTTTATYFVRVYIDKANKHEIAYGQSTNENKTTNLFQIDGVVAPPEPQPQPGSAWSLVGSSLGYRYAWFLVLLLVYVKKDVSVGYCSCMADIPKSFPLVHKDRLLDLFNQEVGEDVARVREYKGVACGLKIAMRMREKAEVQCCAFKLVITQRMAALPRCDELRRAACSPEWEDMFILYCRRAIAEDIRLAREINGLCDGLTAVIKERELFICELDTLVDRFMPEKMCKFLKETQAKDTDKLMKLQILSREFEIQAREINCFIEKLKGTMDY